MRIVPVKVEYPTAMDLLTVNVRLLEICLHGQSSFTVFGSNNHDKTRTLRILTLRRELWFSKWIPWTSGMNTTWEFTRNTHFQAP